MAKDRYRGELLGNAEAQGLPERSLLLSPWLDAHLLFGWEYLSSDTIEPFFRSTYSEAPLAEVVAALASEGLLEERGGGRWAVPPGRRSELADLLGRTLLEAPLAVAGWEIPAGELLAAFRTFLGELYGPDIAKPLPEAGVWGGASFRTGRRVHHLLVRPYAVPFEPPGDAFLCTLCALPAPAVSVLSERIVSLPALRRSTAFADTSRGWKVNLTRSEVFVHLERFLWRSYRLRLIPAPALTEALLAAGILVLEKG
ncbi:MAG: hypothetical protein ACP5SI_01925 [Chloroflexia bacterium]